MDDKYDVKGKIKEAFDCLQNRIDYIQSTDSFIFGEESYDFLEETWESFFSLTPLFDNNLLDNLFKQKYPILNDAYKRIDFSCSTDDAKMIRWFNSRLYLNSNETNLDSRLNQILIDKGLYSFYRYLIRMVLINRNTYSIDDYCRDLEDIYIKTDNDERSHFIHYSVIERNCQWGAEQKDVMRLKMDHRRSRSRFERL